MAGYVLRGVNWNRWQRGVEEKTQTADGVCEPLLMADVLLDMKTTNNRLSVYFVDDVPEQILPVVVGLAAGRQRLDRFDYVLFERDLLEQLGIGYRHSDGEGLHRGANQWHVDLEGLTLYQMAELIVCICCDEATQLRRINKPEMGQAMIEAIFSGDVAESDVAEKLQAEAMRHYTQG
jgi:hypothetical protein